MDEFFNKIAGYLRDRSRLSFAGHKRSILRHRLENRLEQLNLPDFSAYWDYLAVNTGEVANLYDLATTNETFFFRNMAQFDYLRDCIVPQMENIPGKCLRVLCAGCSTGEEPYSVAMTVLDAMSPATSLGLEIIAGDISNSCLRIAKKGYYEEEKLDKMPPHYMEKYIDRVEGGGTVKPLVRRSVKFIHLNLNDLMQGETVSGCVILGGFDMIFCRNVMIYFASPCQQLLVDTLDRLLLPGGYLFTGDAEPLHLFRHDFTPVTADRCLIYKKTGTIQ